MEKADSSLYGKPQDLSKLVEYSQGSVISKTILNRGKTGTITLFSFDKGEGLSEHTAPFDAFVSIIDGVAKILINNQPQTVKAGESIILPANIPHALEATSPFKMLLVMIRA